MVNRLTHDDNGKRLKKLQSEPEEIVQAVANNPRQHIGARKNKLTPVLNETPRQLGVNAPALSREYEVLKELVRSDHQRIKNSPDDREKIKKEKSRLLNQYREYLTAWIAAGERHNNDVLFFNIVWAADVGEWNWLLTLTDYAVETGQVNDIFKSEPQAIAAREVYYAADRAIEYHDDRATKSIAAVPACFADVLGKVESGDWTIPKALKAKFFKIAGIICQFNGGDENLQKAKVYYTEAESLDSKVGCKGRLKEVSTLLNEQEKHHDSN
jgi:hypothetical protein